MAHHRYSTPQCHLQIRQIFKRKLQRDHDKVESQTASSTFKVKALSHRRKKEPRSSEQTSEQWPPWGFSPGLILSLDLCPML